MSNIDIVRRVQSNYGYTLRYRIFGPEPGINELMPVVFMVPGGWDTDLRILNSPIIQEIVLSKRIIFVTYHSPMLDNRIYPLGHPDRDYKGYKDQEDVVIILARMRTIPWIDQDRFCIWSHSSGIITVSGVLGRYAKLTVPFYVDFEGPSDIQTILTDGVMSPELKIIWHKILTAKVGIDKDYADEETFFAERTAYKFISCYTGTYLRLQQERDHALGKYYKHAVSMLNAAILGSTGTVSLNKEPPGCLYHSGNFGPPIGRNIDTTVTGVCISERQELDVILYLLGII